jgi:hypothetical protein
VTSDGWEGQKAESQDGLNLSGLLNEIYLASQKRASVMKSADQGIEDAVINDLPHELYPSLSEKRIILESYKENIIKLGKSKRGNFIEDANCTDLVLLGIIHRSIKINEGFIFLIDKWNLLCAAPMIRLQIDTLLRLSYLSTLEDQEDISKNCFLEKGSVISKVKTDRN